MAHGRTEAPGGPLLDPSKTTADPTGLSRVVEPSRATRQSPSHRREHATAERFKSMEAYYANAIDVTMVRREQERIGAEVRPSSRATSSDTVFRNGLVDPLEPRAPPADRPSHGRRLPTHSAHRHRS